MVGATAVVTPDITKKSLYKPKLRSIPILLMNIIFKILKVYKYKGEQIEINHHPTCNNQNKKGFLKEGSL